MWNNGSNVKALYLKGRTDGREIQRPQISRKGLEASEKRHVGIGIEKLYIGGGVHSTAAGTQEGAGTNKVMGQFLIGACVAINGIRFTRESEGAAVISTNRERTTIGERKNNTRSAKTWAKKDDGRQENWNGEVKCAWRRHRREKAKSKTPTKRWQSERHRRARREPTKAEWSRGECSTLGQGPRGRGRGGPW